MPVHLILAFVAGFCDAAAFVGLSGLFVAHVTGNIVLLAVAVAGAGTGHVLAKLLALPVFLISAAASHLLLRIAMGRGKPALRIGLLCEAALLMLFLGFALAAAVQNRPDAPIAIVAGMAGVAAMGFQSIVVREAMAGRPSTNAMTANASTAVVDGFEAIRGVDRAQALARLYSAGSAVAAFGLGAGAGATGIRLIGFACLALPLALVLAASLRREAGREGRH